MLAGEVEPTPSNRIGEFQYARAKQQRFPQVRPINKALLDDKRDAMLVKERHSARDRLSLGEVPSAEKGAAIKGPLA